MNHFRYAVRGTTPDHHANRYLIVKQAAAATAFTLATDATTEQPSGVIVDGDDNLLTVGSVAVAGLAPVLVGEAGLAVGFRWITCDDEGKAKAATLGTDAILGYAYVSVAKTEDQTQDVFICPKPVDIDTDT